jgi:hypothetical protein
MKNTIVIRKWVETELWDDCYFQPERLGPKSILYSTSFSGPLIGLLIEGHQARAPWRTEELFTRLRPLAERYPCSWIHITDPDDAVSVLQWEQPYSPDLFTPRQLWVFEMFPADQGGRSRLVLAFHDHSGLIVFEFHPGRSFEIAFYGHAERLNTIHEYI